MSPAKSGKASHPAPGSAPRGQPVPGDIDHVASKSRKVVPPSQGLRAQVSSEGAFAVGFNQGDVEAGVALRVGRPEDRDPLGGEGGADQVAPGPGAVAARVQDREALARRGGHDVETAADRYAGGGGEKVAAAVPE